MGADMTEVPAITPPLPTLYDGDAISALDKGESGRTGPHPDVFDYIPGENR